MNLPSWTMVALLVAAPFSSQAGTAGAGDPAEAALVREARQIETMLIAPCCWTQPVSEHQSQASDEVKQRVRELLAEGKTRQQVLDAFVAQYGKRILAEPPGEGFGRVLYTVPLLAFLLGGAALFVLVRRMTARRPDLDVVSVQPAQAGDEERLDEELRNLD
jgi:cytochrome c-type biogenesis protein CcmH